MENPESTHAMIKMRTRKDAVEIASRNKVEGLGILQYGQRWTNCKSLAKLVLMKRGQHM